RDVRGSGDRHYLGPGAALWPRLPGTLPGAQGHRLGLAAGAVDFHRLQRSAECFSISGKATRAATPATGGASYLPAPWDESTSFRDRHFSRHAHPKSPVVRVRPDIAHAGLRVLAACPRRRGDGTELDSGANPASDPVAWSHRSPGGMLLFGPACYPLERMSTWSVLNQGVTGPNRYQSLCCFAATHWQAINYATQAPVSTSHLV